MVSNDIFVYTTLSMQIKRTTGYFNLFYFFHVRFQKHLDYIILKVRLQNCINAILCTHNTVVISLTILFSFRYL